MGFKFTLHFIWVFFPPDIDLIYSDITELCCKGIQLLMEFCYNLNNFLTY